MLLADRKASRREIHNIEPGQTRYARLPLRQGQCIPKRRDAQVLVEIKKWMARELHCIAGRREYSRGRYMIRNASKGTVETIFEKYTTLVARGEVVACLMVFNDNRFYQGCSDTGTAFYFLAEQMATISDISPVALANGASLTKAARLRCPVTNQLTLFDDFECIAFCPQSAEKADPLYDPLMYAPYPCVNISSDVYAFSRFVGDSALAAWNKPVYEETDIERIATLFERCIDRWQRVAVAIIRNFEANTDTSLCPVHVTPDNGHWIAAHKDPAFAEQKKEVHQHELPVLYANRITERWLRFFKEKKTYDAAGLAREGVPVPAAFN